jgi:hypothetical protein
VPIQHASLAAWDGKNWHSLSSLIDELDEVLSPSLTDIECGSPHLF